MFLDVRRQPHRNEDDCDCPAAGERAKDKGSGGAVEVFQSSFGVPQPDTSLEKTLTRLIHDAV
jgi:hypothetical protein